MADFSFDSDNNDSEVEEILAQAMDECVLEQVAAINCSGFSDSVLSNDLETRFRKLKSFPETNQKPRTQETHHLASKSMKNEVPTSYNSPMKEPTSSCNEATTDTAAQEQLQNATKGKESPDTFSDVEDVFSTSKKRREKKGSKSKKGRSSSSLAASSDSSEAGSPPRQKCLFWCSPKKVSRKKDKQKRVEDLLDRLGLDKDDELFSDLSTFSSEEQQKKLKKALKEEEKVAREAKKIVEWAKQASARMNVSVTPDVSSDDERFK